MNKNIYLKLGTTHSPRLHRKKKINLTAVNVTVNYNYITVFETFLTLEVGDENEMSNLCISHASNTSIKGDLTAASGMKLRSNPLRTVNAFFVTTEDFFDKIVEGLSM